MQENKQSLWCVIRKWFLAIAVVLLFGVTSPAALVAGYDYTSMAGKDPTAQGWTQYVGGTLSTWLKGYDASIWAGQRGWRLVDGTGYGTCQYQKVPTTEQIEAMRSGWVAEVTFTLDSDAWGADGTSYVADYYLTHQTAGGFFVRTPDPGYAYYIQLSGDTNGDLRIYDGVAYHSLTGVAAFDTQYTVTVTYDGTDAILSYGGQSLTMGKYSSVGGNPLIAFGSHSTSGQDSIVYDTVALSTTQSLVEIIESDGSTQVNEQGPTSDTYTIGLGGDGPQADVIMTLSLSDPDQVVLDVDGIETNTITFTPSNYNQPRTVSVTAIDDALSQATHYTLISHNSSSMDSVYNNLEIPDVRVTITDNDGNRIKVFLIGGQSNAAGAGLNTEYPTLYQTPQYDVEFWNGGRLPGDGVPNYTWDRDADTAFRPLELGSGNSLDGTLSGFEMSLGRAIKDALPYDKIAIVKYGMSGSALYRGLRPDGAGDWDSDPAPLNGSFDGVRYYVFRNSAVLPALQAITGRGDIYGCSFDFT